MAQQDKLVTLDDMYKAYEDCRRKKKNKYGTVKFEQYALFNCLKLVDEINERKYKLKPSECFIVEYPTPREVFCASFRDRVVQHFVYNELNPVIEKMLISDTCSCRLRKGTDYAIKREIRKLRQVTELLGDGSTPYLKTSPRTSVWSQILRSYGLVTSLHIDIDYLLWRKRNDLYFICCRFNGVECTLIEEGEEQNQYNVNTPHYGNYGTVICDKV